MKLKSEDVKRKRETMTAAQKKLFEKKKGLNIKLEL